MRSFLGPITRLLKSNTFSEHERGSGRIGKWIPRTIFFSNTGSSYVHGCRKILYSSCSAPTSSVLTDISSGPATGGASGTAPGHSAICVSPSGDCQVIGLACALPPTANSPKTMLNRFMRLHSVLANCPPTLEAVFLLKADEPIHGLETFFQSISNPRSSSSRASVFRQWPSRGS